MGYGGGGIGSLVGGLAQGYEQGRRQVWAERLQQADFLQRQAAEHMRMWQSLPEGPTKDLALVAWAQAQEQSGKLLNDKGPGNWNEAKHVFGMIPGLGHLIKGPTGPNRNV